MASHDWMLIYRPATLVFNTIHFDKAGETSDFRVVEAEIADVTPTGDTLILVTREGIHLHFPIRMVYPAGPSDTPPELQTYIGGQELTRDFHPPQNAERTSLRWLTREEVEQFLENADK